MMSSLLAPARFYCTLTILCLSQTSFRMDYKVALCPETRSEFSINNTVSARSLKRTKHRLIGLAALFLSLALLSIAN